MHQFTTDIRTDDGDMETYVCHPDRNGPHPAVLFLMDAPGVREELRDMARRLASSGYFVLLPNLYYRAGRDSMFGAEVLDKDSSEHTRMRAIRTRMTIPPVMRDVGAMLNFIDANPGAANGPVGAQGYCLSGPYALAAAACYPQRIAAAASLYGTWLVSDAELSPHLTFGATTGELYMACAEHDALAPPDMVVELRQHFADSGARGEIEHYPGVHHGFAFPGRWCFDKLGAERHWTRLLSLYARNLHTASQQ
jgi:carboxymethylenebutenolidase